MADACPPIEEFEAIRRLDARDPRRRHVEECPRCRALLAAYRAFMAGRDELADPAAEARLGELLAREIAAEPEPESVPAPVPASPGPPPLGGLLAFLRTLAGPQLLRPALAAATVLIIGIAVLRPWQPAPEHDIVLRGESSPGAERVVVLQPPRLVAGGELELGWSACPGADGYRVQLLSTGLTEVARFEVDADTTLRIPAARLAAPGAASPQLLWRVEALLDGDVIAHSRPAALPAPQR